MSLSTFSISILSLSLLVGAAACGKKPQPTPSTVPAPSTAPAPEADAGATPEADAAEPADVLPPLSEPTEKEAKETWDVFLAEGRKFVRSMSNERIDILTQLREIKFEEETEKYKAQVATIADKLQEFDLGDSPETLETAVDRMCALIEEVRGPAQDLLGASQAELEKVTADLKVLDEKQAAGGTVLQREFDKLEKLQKRLSGPPLAGRYVLLTVRSLLDEAMVIVDYGVQRARRKLYACLTKINEKPLELELAQQNLERVMNRARKLLAFQ
ncbi:MAG: hypothetical protein IT373_24965 [Polyangiaceae bacterium]|nr:hypothetical protein [Polyangiaceae bacterium]